MTDAERLANELNRFVRIVDDLAAIATRTDPERRHELIKLRRSLSDQIGALRNFGAKAFRDPTVTDEFRSRLSLVLTTVSLHQANWPAITIDEGKESYRQSAVAAAEGNRAFIDWTRLALARQAAASA